MLSGKTTVFKKSLLDLETFKREFTQMKHLMVLIYVEQHLPQEHSELYVKQNTTLM